MAEQETHPETSVTSSGQSNERKSDASRSFDVWLWRLYLLAFSLFVVASILAGLDGRLSLAYWPVLIAGAIPLVLWLRSIAAFPGRYSLAGDSTRQEGRSGIVLLESKGGGGSIGGVHFERVDWRLHQYGLEVRVPGAGWGFVPAVSLRSVRKAPRGVIIEHWASEVRSPIQLESSSDLRRLLELWIESRDPEDSSRD